MICLPEGKEIANFLLAGGRTDVLNVNCVGRHGVGVVSIWFLERVNLKPRRRMYGDVLVDLSGLEWDMRKLFAFVVWQHNMC